VSLKVDVIVVAGGVGHVRAAKNATKTIPIVMTGGGAAPVEADLVESLARPGGNVTGITNLTGELARISHNGIISRAASPENTFTSMIPGRSTLLPRRQTGNWTPIAAIRLCTSR
jgi:ABC transporter substrate binding protein